jgi:hypothetical protein
MLEGRRRERPDAKLRPPRRREQAGSGGQANGVGLIEVVEGRCSVAGFSSVESGQALQTGG